MLPPGQADTARGTVRLYRPSDSRVDVELPLAVDSRGEQRLSLQGLRMGQWVFQVRWTTAGHDYYFEEPVWVR
jgi:nitrogen fixation protein FixH